VSIPAWVPEIGLLRREGGAHWAQLQHLVGQRSKSESLGAMMLKNQENNLASSRLKKQAKFVVEGNPILIT
jgi:hypothetical protein